MPKLECQPVANAGEVEHRARPSRRAHCSVGAEHPRAGTRLIENIDCTKKNVHADIYTTVMYFRSNRIPKKESSLTFYKGNITSDIRRQKPAWFKSLSLIQHVHCLPPY